MESKSLKPELELEVLKSILLRENYLKKLNDHLKTSSGNLNTSTVNFIDLLRESTLQVIEIIDDWEKCQVSYPAAKVYSWNGQNYLEKMLQDTRSLQHIRNVENWLGFSLINNPFFIPLDILPRLDSIPSSAYIIFGENIPKPRRKLPTKKDIFHKSPYTTPIINDPEIFQHLSAKTKLDEKFTGVGNELTTFHQHPNSDSLKCFVSIENLKRIYGCFLKLARRFDEFSFLNVVADTSKAGMIVSETESLNIENNNFVDFLKKSSAKCYAIIDNKNEYDRIFSNSGAENLYWTPHEVNLQKQVQRRGGELYVISAASTKGRIQVPWRQTRYNRMQNDLIRWRNTTDLLGMIAEDLFSQLIRLQSSRESNRFSYQRLLNDYNNHYSAKSDADMKLKFLIDQFRSFEQVSENGKLTNLQTQRILHQLPDGHSRESDQLVSISFENKMVKKIQLLVRKAFGRALRKAEIARRELAALKIQTHWRLFRVGKKLKNKIYELKLALMVQRLFRLKSAEKLRRQLYTEAIHRTSSLQIQRVFRGFLGRKRLNLKREFNKALLDASQSVSLMELKPGDIEDLADLIEDYIRDYTLTVPLHVLTILRGILYLTNGDSGECVIINNEEGYTEKKFIFAASSSWNSIKLILRRKGRYLRRLRALVANTCLPNPSRLSMTDDCKCHISAICNNIEEDDFAALGRAKKCATQLLKYCKNIYRAYVLQEHFPEYFKPGFPFWFRKIMRTREIYDRSQINYLIEVSANRRIDEVKTIHSREGKKYSHISSAVSRNQFDLNNSRLQWNRQAKKLQSSLQQLVDIEQKQLLTLEAIVRAKTLARDVSEGDLKEYLRATFIPDERHLKELHYKIDMKNIALIQSQTELLYQQKVFENNQTFRDFNKHLKLEKMHKYCDDLGTMKGDLFVLLESWNSLLHDIGGIQYVKDLKNEKLARYQFIQHKVSHFLRARKELIGKIDAELIFQYSNIYNLIKTHNLKLTNKKWDDPSSVETDYEEFENKECCKRDFEAEFRKRRSMERVQVISQFESWQPLMIILDNKLPRDFIFHFKSYFEQTFSFHFRSLAHFSLQANSGNIITDLQKYLDLKVNLLVLMNFDYLHVLDEKYDMFIQSIVSVLIPTPTVLLLNGRNCYTADPWKRWISNTENSIASRETFDSHNFPLDFADEENDDGVFVGKLTLLGLIFEASFAKDPAEHQLSIVAEPKRVLFYADFQKFLGSLRKIRSNFTAINVDSTEPIFLIDAFLAFNLSILWNIYTVPLSTETSQLENFHIFQGAFFLRHYLSSIDIIKFSSLFQQIDFKNLNQSEANTESRRPYYIHILHQLKRVNASFHSCWSKLQAVDVFSTPARYWLKRYIGLMNEYIERKSDITNSVPIELAANGTKVYFVSPNVSTVREFCCSIQFKMSFASEVMHVLLQNFEVFRSSDILWKLCFNRDCMSSTLVQSLGTANYSINQTTLNRTPTEASELIVYHFGDELFVELKLVNDCKLFDVEKNHAEISRSLELIGFTLQAKAKALHRYVARMNIQDLITMLQPNFTEIFEGSIKKLVPNIQDNKENAYYRLFSSWLCFDVIGKTFDFSFIRTRYLILSNLGKISGYFVRLEVYEEKFGEIRILVFGLEDPSKEIYQVKVDRSVVFNLLNFCDEQYERDKLEALNSLKMSYIFANRVVVRPSIGLKSCMNNGELLPQMMFENYYYFNHYGKSEIFNNDLYKIDFRRTNGPGRLIGKKIINLLNMFFASDKHSQIVESTKNIFCIHDNKNNSHMNQFIVSVSVYEIYSENNVNDLRIVLYYYFNQQTVEYRISAMERMMLFDEHANVFPQLLKRIRLVFCDLQQEVLDHHPFLKLSSNFTNIKSDEKQQDSRSIIDNLSDFESWLRGDPYDLEGERNTIYVVLRKSNKC